MIWLLGLCAAEYVEISQRNEATIIGGPRPSLVKFYFPGCPHCDGMAPAFARAAQSDNGALFGGVDCSQHEGICEKFNVQGYPTVLFFQSGSRNGVEYMGDRSPKSFTNFVRLQLNSQNSDSSFAGKNRHRHSRRNRVNKIIESLAKQAQ